jgi:hypothetical protein
MPVVVSVRHPATLPVLILFGAVRRLYLWKTGQPPGLSRLRGQPTGADPCNAGRAAQPLRPSRLLATDARDSGCADSSDGLLKPLAAAITANHNAALGRDPSDRRADPRVTGEDSVAIPNRRLQRARELVTPAPTLDIDQRATVNAAQGDRPDTTALPRPTRKRHRGNRRAAPLKLRPHVLAHAQLRAPPLQPGRVWLGGLSTRRRPAHLASHRPARRAQPAPPATREMKPRRGITLLPRRTAPTARAGRHPANRAPLIKPRAAVAHDAPPPHGRVWLSPPCLRGRSHSDARVMHAKSWLYPLAVMTSRAAKMSHLRAFCVTADARIRTGDPFITSEQSRRLPDRVRGRSDSVAIVLGDQCLDGAAAPIPSCDQPPSHEALTIWATVSQVTSWSSNRR